MKSYRVALVALFVASSSAIANADTATVPNGYESTLGTGSFIGPLANGGRTLQLLIHADQLTDFIGQQLNGISWRLPANATGDWPTADVSYDSFDIYLSGSVDPADRSLTFSENVVGAQTQVRSGALTFSAGDYPSGGAPNDFGLQVDFSDYAYSGGNLLIEIRHSGTGISSRTVDAIAASTGEPLGYGTQFSAAWASGPEAVTGLQGNFTIIQLSSSPIPTPGVLSLIGIAGLAATRRRR